MSISNEQAVAFLKKNPISVGCTLLALALGFAIYTRADALGLAQTDLEQKTAEGERLAMNLKYSAQLKEQVDAITEANAKIVTRLVRPTEIAINYQYFYRLEAETETKLLEINQLPVAAPKGGAKPNFVPVGYSVGIQGTYSQALNFLRRVENGVHFSRVLSATITPVPGDAADRVTLRLNLELLGAP